jgi:hypothetical protein
MERGAGYNHVFGQNPAGALAPDLLRLLEIILSNLGKVDLTGVQL